MSVIREILISPEEPASRAHRQIFGILPARLFMSHHCTSARWHLSTEVAFVSRLFLHFLILFIIISYIITIRQNPLLTINGTFPINAPLTSHPRFPALTRYFTISAFFISIPAPLNTVAIHATISAITCNIFQYFLISVCSPTVSGQKEDFRSMSLSNSHCRKRHISRSLSPIPMFSLFPFLSFPFEFIKYDSKSRPDIPHPVSQGFHESHENVIICDISSICPFNSLRSPYFRYHFHFRFCFHSISSAVSSRPQITSTYSLS